MGTEKAEMVGLESIGMDTAKGVGMMEKVAKMVVVAAEATGAVEVTVVAEEKVAR